MSPRCTRRPIQFVVPCAPSQGAEKVKVNGREHDLALCPPAHLPWRCLELSSCQILNASKTNDVRISQPRRAGPP
jgi:hypothetical protein